MRNIIKYFKEIMDLIAFKLEKFANDLEYARWENVKKRIEKEFEEKLKTKNHDKNI